MLFFHEKFDGDVYFGSRYYFWYIFGKFLYAAFKYNLKHALCFTRNWFFKKYFIF